MFVRLDLPQSLPVGNYTLKLISSLGSGEGETKVLLDDVEVTVSSRMTEEIAEKLDAAATTTTTTSTTTSTTTTSTTTTKKEEEGEEEDEPETGEK